ncbi:MAG: glutaredoxin [Chthoniobacterales bacterium]|nr:glutaredoxin [Chthoniobacterales bacterium]
MQITAYLKTTCRWSNGVRAALAKYNLSYTEKDIIIHPEFRLEMEQKSGQPLSPCVEVDGVMLADISGEELEQYLLEKKLVSPSSVTSNAPLTSASCTH